MEYLLAIANSPETLTVLSGGTAALVAWALKKLYGVDKRLTRLEARLEDCPRFHGKLLADCED